jgi:hypothetical protein
MGLAPSKPGYFAELSGHREVPVPIFSQPLREMELEFKPTFPRKLS